jgi:hypothetical protein
VTPSEAKIVSRFVEANKLLRSTSPLAVHKREMRSLLGLLRVALQRHAEIFTGSSTFCVRTFAHLLPLLTCAGLR